MFADEPFEYTGWWQLTLLLFRKHALIVSFSDYVRPACLPTASFDFEEGHMIISGLGKTEKGWVEPMMYATIPMCNQSACKERFRTMYKSK